MRTFFMAAVAALLLLPAGEVGANPLKSRLTTIDLKVCKQTVRSKDGGVWICPGLPGFPVYVAEGDLRFMLAFGSMPQQRRSATQTLGAFNTIFSDKARPTIEWRIERIDERRERPFATIVRYHTTRDGEHGEALVVTKVDRSASCRLAVIDATANENAMAIARAWADAEARKRPCPEAPEVIGRQGRGPL